MNINELVDVLKSGNNSLVVAKTMVRTYDGRGVKDLFRLLNEEPDSLAGAMVADKVVGKGAAALMVLAHVAEVYADVLSEPAQELLVGAGIRTSCGTLVPYIINRAGTGMCPLEARCSGCNTAEECLVEISSFMEEMKRMQGNLIGDINRHSGK